LFARGDNGSPMPRHPRAKRLRALQRLSLEHLSTRFEFCAELYSFRSVHIEHLNGSSTHGGEPDNRYVSQFKVRLPPLVARVEERGDVAALWINASQVRAFVKVAVVTG
jgi:hypothetical protein